MKTYIYTTLVWHISTSPKNAPRVDGKQPNYSFSRNQMSFLLGSHQVNKNVDDFSATHHPEMLATTPPTPKAIIFPGLANEQ